MHKNQFEYSHNNFVRYGYDENLYNLRTSPSQKFKLSYSPCTRPPQSFEQELVNAALLVESKTQNAIWVCFSGGMDSEITLRAFLNAGIPVSAAILRFAGGVNDHDISYAMEFCRQNKVEFRIFEIDVDLFLETNLSRFDYLQCCSPQFLSVIWLMEQIIELGGCPVVGNGDICIKRTENTNAFNFIEKEKYFSYYHFLRQNGVVGIPAFLQYTPELFLSFLLSDKLLYFIKGEAKKRKMLSISKFKYDIYNSFFPIEPREIFNGYEHIPHIDAKFREILMRRFPSADTEIKIPYEDLVSTLRVNS
jgi:hypothetical protein